MFKRGFQYILEAFICWNFLIIDAYGSCDMMNRIKNRDVGINVTVTESPCRMTARSNDHRQVVAVIYNFQRNCIGSGIMTVLTDNTLTAEYCGDGIIPNPINVRAKMLTLEYITNDLIAYTGFTATYSVCIQEANASQSKGAIEFSRFPLIDRACIFIFGLQERRRIQLHLDSYLNIQRNCSQYITIFKDSDRYDFSSCDGSLVLHATEIRVVFDLENGETFEGNYSIDLSTSEQDQTTLVSASNDKTPDDPAIIVGVSVAVIVVVIAFTFTIIVVYRRKNLTFKACRTTDAGSHTSRDQVNLQSNNSEAHYESPIVPISDNNYSVPDQRRADNVRLEDAYDDIGTSTKDQGSYYNVPVSNTSASEETSGGYYNTSASEVTYNNQQEHMYEGTLVDMDIDKQTYSKLHN